MEWEWVGKEETKKNKLQLTFSAVLLKELKAYRISVVWILCYDTVVQAKIPC